MQSTPIINCHPSCERGGFANDEPFANQEGNQKVSDNKFY